jgi:SAM-dependent methyltransferase
MTVVQCRGVVEHVSRVGIRGWAAVPESATPVQVTIVVDGKEEARIPARLPRDDMRLAGHSITGLCGFEFLWQTVLPDEMHGKVRVLAGPSNEELSSAPGGQPLSLYNRLFAGSFGVDNTVPEAAFLSSHYTRHNARRLEHLASLGLPLHGRSVLEFGAGVGDHSSFYLDRGCEVLATDARVTNLALLESRLRDHPKRGKLQTTLIDVDLDFDLERQFDVVHCYGLFYHLVDPAGALTRMAKCCRSLFLLETKTDPGVPELVVAGAENAAESYNSFSGRNARPTRSWIARELRRHFRFVYFPNTTPAHEEFPPDWSDLSAVPDGWPRTVVVGSRDRIDQANLQPDLPQRLVQR